MTESLKFKGGRRSEERERDEEFSDRGTPLRALIGRLFTVKSM